MLVAAISCSPPHLGRGPGGEHLRLDIGIGLRGGEGYAIHGEGKIAIVRPVDERRRLAHALLEGLGDDRLAERRSAGNGGRLPLLRQSVAVDRAFQRGEAKVTRQTFQGRPPGQCVLQRIDALVDERDRALAGDLVAERRCGLGIGLRCARRA